MQVVTKTTVEIFNLYFTDIIVLNFEKCFKWSVIFSLVIVIRFSYKVYF